MVKDERRCGSETVWAAWQSSEAVTSSPKAIWGEKQPCRERGCLMVVQLPRIALGWSGSSPVRWLAEGWSWQSGGGGGAHPGGSCHSDLRQFWKWKTRVASHSLTSLMAVSHVHVVRQSPGITFRVISIMTSRLTYDLSHDLVHDKSGVTWQVSQKWHGPLGRKCNFVSISHFIDR